MSLALGWCINPSLLDSNNHSLSFFKLQFSTSMFATCCLSASLVFASNWGEGGREEENGDWLGLIWALPTSPRHTSGIAPVFSQTKAFSDPTAAPSPDFSSYSGTCFVLMFVSVDTAWLGETDQARRDQPSSSFLSPDCKGAALLGQDQGSWMLSVGNK